MATIQNLVADLATAVQALPGYPARLGSDYREDLEPVPQGETRYQLRAAIAGVDGDSNITRQLASVTLVLLHKLTAPLNERGYTEGNLQTYLASFSVLSWWRALASVHRLVAAPTVEIERVGNVVRLEVEASVSLKP